MTAADEGNVDDNGDGMDQAERNRHLEGPYAGDAPRPMSLDAAERLFMAAVQGDLPALEAALADGADPNAPEAASQMSIVGWAARMGRAACVRRLIQAGADPWAAVDIDEARDTIRSAVAYAVEHSRWNVIPELLPDGIEDYADDYRVRNILNDALSRAQVGAATALAEAEAEAEAGLDIDGFMINGASLLGAACSNPHCHLVAAELLGLGADPNKAFPTPHKRVATALAMAVCSASLESIKLLLAAGASAAPVEGQPCLSEWLLVAHPQSAIVHEAPKVLALLEGAGAGLATGERGRKFMARAVEHDRPDLVAWLGDLGVDPAIGVEGSSALELATRHPEKKSSCLVQAYALVRKEQRELTHAASASNDASTRPRTPRM